MKTLLLLRHAKSSWDDTSLSDFDRPLNERGKKAAPLVGEYLKTKAIKPGLVLCSPAVRARQTAELALEAAGIETEVRFDERIYDASVGQLMKIVSEIEDAAEVVMLVGHNYGIEQLLERLTGEARQMKTATLACVNLPVESWSEVGETRGSLELYVRPKDLAKE